MTILKILKIFLTGVIQTSDLTLTFAIQSTTWIPATSLPTWTRMIVALFFGYGYQILIAHGIVFVADVVETAKRLPHETASTRFGTLKQNRCGDVQRLTMVVSLI